MLLVNDTRKCSECTCGPPSGGKCVAETVLFRNENCGDPLITTILSAVDAPACTSAIGDGDIVSMGIFALQSEPATCVPSEPVIVSGRLEEGKTHVACCDR
ncbi:hypothetical protein [Sorangium sp. So ce131]|uniref:hypothetical protein n=1 Tax=Sorangium sp. So ce131 TaxID=3133282 RepID=UPI003F61577F